MRDKGCDYQQDDDCEVDGVGIGLVHACVDEQNDKADGKGQTDPSDLLARELIARKNARVVEVIARGIDA